MLSVHGVRFRTRRDEEDSHRTVFAIRCARTHGIAFDDALLALRARSTD